MPTYTFTNEKDEEWEETLKISELDEYKKLHNCTVVINGTTPVVRGVGSLHSKVDGDFKSKMAQIKRDFPSSTSLKDW
jgi:hypothetical protein